jgi:hypothetical protein
MTLSFSSAKLINENRLPQPNTDFTRQPRAMQNLPFPRKERNMSLF